MLVKGKFTDELVQALCCRPEVLFLLQACELVVQSADCSHFIEDVLQL
jgi:hypothetical protein